MEFDAIIVGGGHNGLVAAAYLARTGRKVLVLERRGVLGGSSVTEEVWPGYKVSVMAFVTSMFHASIVKDLELHRYGYEPLRRDPAAFLPLRDGRSLTFWVDHEKTAREIAKLNERDGEAFPRYVAWILGLAGMMEGTLDATPPNVPPRDFDDFVQMAKLGMASRGRGSGAQVPDLVDLMMSSASRILDQWFESDELKAVLAAEGLLGTFAGPRSPGTGAALMHFVLGETDGDKGVWSCPRGGMGALSMAIARSAQASGVTIRTGASVAKILVQRGRVSGVELVSGERILADTVLANTDPNVTFRKLVGDENLPATFVRALKKIDYSSASFRVNLALSELPRFECLPSHGREGLPQHRGSIHILGGVNDIERAFDEAKYGVPSARPTLHCSIPTALDDSLAPKGKHIMNIFAQYAPFELASGTWADAKESFADACIAMLAEHAPNVPRAILHRQAVSPAEFESVYGLTGGNIFHGALTQSQMFAFRPVPGWAKYRTPVHRLYLCGSGAHPGGGVTGIPGKNAAMAVISDDH